MDRNHAGRKYDGDIATLISRKVSIYFVAIDDMPQSARDSFDGDEPIERLGGFEIVGECCDDSRLRCWLMANIQDSEFIWIRQ